MNEYEDICQAIDTIINKRLSAIGCNYYVDGVIISKQVDGTYTVKINEQTYTGIKAKTGLSLSVGDAVQVCVKNGDFSRKFIDDEMII